MIEIITTAESVAQAEALLQADVDALYVGADEFGLRMPASLSEEEIMDITQRAQAQDKRVIVAVNAIMHNDRIEQVVPYMQGLAEMGVDAITVGDTGVIHLLRKYNIPLPYIYDAQTLVTSANQINFWVQRGATGAVVARELTYEELKVMRQKVSVPLEVQVYGATCIYQSKRPLVQNYFNFTEQSKSPLKEEGLFLAEYKDADTHYSVFEDRNGTHIYATDDINLMAHLDMLVSAQLTTWKLDGIFTKGERFVDIAKLFVAAKRAFSEGTWSEALKEQLQEQVVALHPEDRTLDTGFLLKSPDEIK